MSSDKGKIRAREIPRIRPQTRCEPGKHLAGCGCEEVAAERRVREREERLRGGNAVEDLMD